MRTRFLAAAAAVSVISLSTRVEAQHEPHHPAQPDTSAHGDSAMQMTMPAMPERPFEIPMTRMGSGTAWLPDASAMPAWNFTAGGWMLMVHGDAFLQYDHQGGPRGADQLGNINWGMVMAMRQVGGGTLDQEKSLRFDRNRFGGVDCGVD